MATRKYPPYGVKRDYPKIDLYRKRIDAPGWHYCGSTTWARTCHFAKNRYLACTGLPRDTVKACFSRARL